MGIFLGATAGRPSGVTINEDFATYDLALADARASGAQGDFYRLTTDGGLWRLWGTSSAGFLVPADWYDRISDVANASGSCYFTSGDNSAALTARGWVEETATGGTVTYDADELILACTTTSGSRARVAFTPTGTPSNFLWVLEISALTFGGAGSPDAGYAGILTRNAADFIKAGFSEGAACTSVFCSSSNGGTADDTGSTQATLAAGWILGIMDAGAGDTLQFEQIAASGGFRAVTMPSDEAAADATGRVIRIEAAKHTSGVSVDFRVKNFRCWSFA